MLVRIQRGQERENYGVTYREAQEAIEAEIPKNLDARTRAYLLVKRHGQTVCKRSNPECEHCPSALPHTGRPWSGDVIGGTGRGLIKTIETLPGATGAWSLALASRRRPVCGRDEGRYLFMTNRRDNP